MLIFVSSQDEIVCYWLKFNFTFLAEVKETIFTAILTKFATYYLKQKKKKRNRILTKIKNHTFKKQIYFSVVFS